MKRTIVVILSLLLAAALCGCGEQKAYEEASSLLEAGEYEAAVEAFAKLGDYEDSAEKLANAENRLAYNAAAALAEAGDYTAAAEAFEKIGNFEDSAGKAVDCRFLNDIQASILNRRDQNARNTDFTTLTNTELSFMGKYKDASFADPALKKYADDYLKGLNDQKEALKISTDKSEYQIAWTEGLVERYDVLNGLYQDYGLLKDDNEFIATYVMDYDNQKAYLQALKEIDSDLHEQLDEITFDYVDAYHFGAPYTNNTKYDFDISVKFTFYKVDNKLITEDDDFESLVAKGTRLDESTNYFDAIKAGSSTQLKFYQPVRNWNVCEFFWTISDVTNY